MARAFRRQNHRDISVASLFSLSDATTPDNNLICFWVNTYNICPPDLPFGGSKQSGFGRENSRFALEGYTEVRSTYMDLNNFEGAY